MTEEVLFAVQGSLGRITLNAPKRLNALSAPMARAIAERLAAWRADDAIRCVLIEGTGERAFCAGGDIVSVYRAGKDGDAAAALGFFRDEYAMNWRIHDFPKPYVAFLDGIVMGGGVGLSLHGSHRVVTEAVTLAMPETGIGFFPDVGTTWALPRLSLPVAVFVVLTGHRLDAADCVATGIATHHAPRAKLADLASALAGADDPASAVAAFAEPPLGASAIAEHRELIDRCFDRESVAEVVAALDHEADPQAAEWAATIRTRSPTSCAVALAALRRGLDYADFAEAMRAEYRLAHGCVARHDFYEGVRAQVVDKDRNPKWRPASLNEVTAEEVEAFFEPAPGEPLPLGWDAG